MRRGVGCGMADGSTLLRCTACRTINRVPQDKLTNRPLCGSCRAMLEFPKAAVNATEATFDREVSDWPGAALVEFWAKGCGYCRMIEPVLNDIASWRAGHLKVIKVDIDAEPRLARRFSVKATPTLIMYRNGQQSARMDGAPKEKLDLVQWVDHHMQQR
jgi:thioredoxin 2